IDAIEGSEANIIERIEAMGTSEARTCARSAVLQVSSLPQMLPESVEAFAASTTTCVARIRTVLDDTTNKRVTDQVGYALHAVAPIALIANRKAGFTTVVNDLQTEIDSSSRVLLAKLKPACYVNEVGDDRPPVPGASQEVIVRCVAYNGDVGTDNQFISATKPVSYTKAKLEAQRNTSDLLAREALRVGVLTPLPS
ncbi:hypothetical protein, partial [Streptomyces cinereoruber]|uniref:hypothetical protein n=1 Tax=Streptomyces cinereoruber TaxID=67260 RepID=UPI00362AA580